MLDFYSDNVKMMTIAHPELGIYTYADLYLNNNTRIADTSGGSIGIGGGYNANDYAVALGNGSGDTQGIGSVAIGYQSAYYDTTPLGDYAIAIGYRAGYDHGHNNSIVLNASGSNLSADQAGLYINPVRYTATQDATYDGLMFFNASTKEVRYSYALDGGSF